MPGAVCIVEVETFLGVFLAEPQGFTLRDLDGCEPGVAGRIVCELEYDINFFQRPECGFRVEEVDEWNDCEVCSGEDDPCAI